MAQSFSLDYCNNYAFVMLILDHNGERHMAAILALDNCETIDGIENTTR